MTPRIAPASLLMAALLLAQPGLAEEYDFEFDIGFSSLNFDGSQTITTNAGSIFNSTDLESDELSLSGTWFFKGLSDEKGPRSRARLTDRASSLTLGYSQTERTSTTVLTSTDPVFPSFDTRFELDDDTIAAGFRYVDRDSGWIGSAGLVTTDTTVGGPVSTSFDATGWQLGFGKYLFENTTLELGFSQVDVDGGADTSAIGVTFEHLGQVNDRWQYGVDLGYNRIDGPGGSDVDAWRAALALYPNRDVEFGIALENASSNLAGDDNLGFEGFASWFVQPNIRLSARYRVDDVDYLGNLSIGGAPTASSADQDSFSINATVRF